MLFAHLSNQINTGTNNLHTSKTFNEELLVHSACATAYAILDKFGSRSRVFRKRCLCTCTNLSKLRFAASVRTLILKRNFLQFDSFLKNQTRAQV